MYGMWYIVFGFVALLIISIILVFISNKPNKDFKDKLYNLEHQWYNNEIPYKDYQKLEKELSLKRTIFSEIIEWSKLAIIFCIILSILFTIIAISGICTANYEYQYFQDVKEMYETLANTPDEIEKYSLMNSVIEQNNWLIEARLSQERWGVFSRFQHLDLNILDFIGK